MIYTELTKKAMCLAFKAHKDQFDKSGIPYIYHPIHLAEQMETEDTCVVALLHDVLEDTDMTEEDLLEAGFTKSQVEAIGMLTHEVNEPYLSYIKRLKSNPIAATVKMADLRHNSDLSRITSPTEKDINRIERKYKPAIEILSGLQ